MPGNTELRSALSSAFPCSYSFHTFSLSSYPSQAFTLTCLPTSELRNTHLRHRVEPSTHNGLVYSTPRSIRHHHAGLAQRSRRYRYSSLHGLAPRAGTQHHDGAALPLHLALGRRAVSLHPRRQLSVPLLLLVRGEQRAARKGPGVHAVQLFGPWRYARVWTSVWRQQPVCAAVDGVCAC